jgi:hypothetical protein
VRPARRASRTSQAPDWRSEIEQARTKNGDHIERDALFWRKPLNNASEPEREVIRELIADEARQDRRRSE